MERYSTNGYKFWYSETKRIIISRDSRCDKNVLICRLEDKPSDEIQENIQEVDRNPVKTKKKIKNPMRDKARIWCFPSFNNDLVGMLCLVK